MKYIIDIPEVPKNDKERYILTHGTPYEEPKQGEWIFRPYADYNPTMGDIVCSKCDIVYFEGVPESRIKGKLYNFCPNCGARMKGGDEK